MTDQPRKKRLGDFEIIRELGRGGMGIVCEARQLSLNRKVAPNSTAQGPSERRLPACTTRDCDAGKMPALRVCDDFALYY